MTPAPLSPAFSRLAWANLAAQSAEQISLAAVPIVAVLALGAGPGEIGALATAQTLPFLLLSIPAGLLADRWSRRRLMVLAEGVRALALLACCWPPRAGNCRSCCSPLLGFIGATGTVGFSVAAPALVPALVPRTRSRRRTAGSSWRAVRPTLPARHLPARWWPGPAPRRPSCWRRCCRPRRWRCCCACPNRPPGRRASARCGTNCATAPAWCGRMNCCALSCSPRSPGTSPGSCCRPPTCPTRCAASGWTRAAWASRSRVTAPAWWWARCARPA